MFSLFLTPIVCYYNIGSMDIFIFNRPILF